MSTDTPTPERYHHGDPTGDDCGLSGDECGDDSHFTVPAPERRPCIYCASSAPSHGEQGACLTDAAREQARREASRTPERVTLTAEEWACLLDSEADDLRAEVENIIATRLAAREQVLREEIKADLMAEADDPALVNYWDDFADGQRYGLRIAARIAGGEGR